jgi:hypothetical protein
MRKRGRKAQDLRLHARNEGHLQQDNALAVMEHLDYVWAHRGGYADRRDGDEGKASLDAPMGKTAVSWKYLGVAKQNEMPSQINQIDCGLLKCKAVENLVGCLPLAGWRGSAMAVDTAGPAPAQTLA